MKKAYIYELNPTDWFFPFKTEKEILEDIEESSPESMVEVQKTVDYAKELFKKYTSWEGDGQAYISGLPGKKSDTFPLLFIAIKQENNGTTFLYSPVKLPYLEDFLKKKI